MSDTAQALVRQALDRLDLEEGSAADILERARLRFSVAFEPLVRVERGGLFGRGPIRSVSLAIPCRGGAHCYVLGRSPAGIDPSVTRVARAGATATERVNLAEWMRALSDDLSGYVERERDARLILERLFGDE